MGNYKLVTTNDFDEEVETLYKINKKLVIKLKALIVDTLEHPFYGLGKPEPLKHDLSGCWSRRINGTHRFVYTVIGDTVKALNCVKHYY